MCIDTLTCVGIILRNSFFMSTASLTVKDAVDRHHFEKLLYTVAGTLGQTKSTFSVSSIGEVFKTCISNPLTLILSTPP